MFSQLSELSWIGDAIPMAARNLFGRPRGPLPSLPSGSKMIWKQGDNVRVQTNDNIWYNAIIVNISENTDCLKAWIPSLDEQIDIIGPEQAQRVCPPIDATTNECEVLIESRWHTATPRHTAQPITQGRWMMDFDLSDDTIAERIDAASVRPKIRIGCGEMVMAIWAHDGKWHRSVVSSIDASKGIASVRFIGLSDEECEVDYPQEIRQLARSESIYELNSSEGGGINDEDEDCAETENTEEIEDGRPSKIRKMVTEEIVRTEASYVCKLQTLIDFWLKPLRESNGILAEKYIDMIFSNIETLVPLNLTLLHDLQERIAKHEKDAHVPLGDIFVRFAPFMKLYSTYTNNHEQATGALKKALTKNEKFSKWYAEKDVKRQSSNIEELASYLIMPVQRVPRYKLLLQELIKNTEEALDEYKQLEHALKAIGSVASHINESVRSSQVRDEVWKLQSQFIGEPQLIAPSRRLIMRGPMVKSNSSGGASKYEFFLFNDLLIYASKYGWKYKLRYQIPINAAFEVHGLSDMDNVHHRCLIVSSIKTIIVSCPSHDKREEWLSKFNIAIHDQRRTIQSPQRAASEYRRELPTYLSSKSFATWTVEDVVIWLLVHGYAPHRHAFETFEIDGPTLGKLSKDHLEFDMDLPSSTAMDLALLIGRLVHMRWSELPAGGLFPRCIDPSKISNDSLFPKFITIASCSCRQISEQDSASHEIVYRINVALDDGSVVSSNKLAINFYQLDTIRIQKNIQLPFELPPKEELARMLCKKSVYELFLQGCCSSSEMVIDVATFVGVCVERLMAMLSLCAVARLRSSSAHTTMNDELKRQNVLTATQRASSLSAKPSHHQHAALLPPRNKPPSLKSNSSAQANDDDNDEDVMNESITTPPMIPSRPPPSRPHSTTSHKISSIDALPKVPPQIPPKAPSSSLRNMCQVPSKPVPSPPHHIIQGMAPNQIVRDALNGKSETATEDDVNMSEALLNSPFVKDVKNKTNRKENSLVNKFGGH